MTSELNTGFPDADSSPGLSLWRVTNAWQRHIRAALAPHKLTHVQFVLLASLTWMDRSEPVTQHELAEHARTDVMMTSQVLRSLQTKGLVRRLPHPSDGRAFTVSPTSEGISTANRAIHDVEAADANFFGALEPRLYKNFLTALHQLSPQNDPTA